MSDGTVQAVSIETFGDFAPDGGVAWLSCGPVTLEVKSASRALADLSSDELIPPWKSELKPPVHGPNAAVVVVSIADIDLRGLEAKVAALGGRWILRDGGAVAWDPRSRCALLALAPGDPMSLAREVLHRQFVQRLLGAEGFVPVHASGLAIGTDGVIAVGDSGVGKTTAQLDLAFALAGAPLGGGRVYTSSDGSLLPFAGRFNVGRGLIENRTALRALSDKKLDGKVALPSSAIADAVGQPLASSGTLACVVFPRLHGGSAVSCRRISENEAWRRFEPQVLVPDPKWRNWLHVVEDIDPLAARAIAREAIRGVPAFDVGIPRRHEPVGHELALLLGLHNERSAHLATGGVVEF